MRLPDFEAWAIFAAVAEAGSLTAAGRQLRLSKATISKALSRLETHIGAPLFHRTTRRLELNETGRSLLARARTMVVEAEALEDAAREEASEPSGLVRVAAPMSFGLARVASAVSEFLCLHPGITVDLQLNDAVIDIVADRFDIAVRIGALADSSLRARRIRPIHRMLVAAPEYFAAHGYPRHPGELSEHYLISYSLLPNPEVWHFTGPNKANVVVTTAGRLRINNGEAMLPALRAGHGIALLPDFIIAADLAKGTLVSILDEWSAPPAGLYLVTPPSPIRARRVSLLLDHLANALAD